MEHREQDAAERDSLLAAKEGASAARNRDADKTAVRIARSEVAPECEAGRGIEPAPMASILPGHKNSVGGSSGGATVTLRVKFGKELVEAPCCIVDGVTALKSTLAELTKVAPDGQTLVGPGGRKWTAATDLTTLGR